MSFYLDKHQWSNFSVFFRMHPMGILHAEDVGRCSSHTEGHTVVVIGEGKQVTKGQVREYWKCKNSWGAGFGDSGRFRVDKLAFPMEWRDVCFYRHDLTPLDVQRFQSTPVRASVIVKASLDNITGNLPAALRTGFEAGQRFDVNFASRNGDQLSSPCQAHPHGRGSFKDMYIVQRGHGQCYAFKLLRRKLANLANLQQEMLKHVAAAGYASTFDAPVHRIKFCVPIVVEVEAAYAMDGNHAASWVGRCGLLEPFLSGSYSKFLFEQTMVHCDLPQAFFHHTYECSGRQVLVWDLQGVANDDSYNLTDPAIVFGVPGTRSNFVVPGVQGTISLDGAHSLFGDQHTTFRELHSCNHLCAQLFFGSAANSVRYGVAHPYPMPTEDVSDDGPYLFELHEDYYDGSEPDYWEPDYDDGPEPDHWEPDYDDGPDPDHGEPDYDFGPEPDDHWEPDYDDGPEPDLW